MRHVTDREVDAHVRRSVQLDLLAQPLRHLVSATNDQIALDLLEIRLVGERFLVDHVVLDHHLLAMT